MDVIYNGNTEKEDLGLNADAEQMTFKGNPVSLFFKSMLNAAIFLFLLSYCLFDLYGLRVYVASLILLVPIMILIVSQNRFTFDDDAKTIKKPMQTPVPYNAVRSVSLYESSSGITLLAATGGLRKRILVESLARDEKDRMLSELTRRLPDIPIQPGRVSFWKIILGAELGILIVCLLMNGYLYVRYPQVKTIPVISSIESPKLIDYRLKGYSAGSISFRLPRAFEMFASLSDGYIFRHMNKTAKMRVIYGTYEHVFGSGRKFIEKVTGLTDVFEFYHMAYYARFGVVPLMLKVMMFDEIEKPVIVQIEQDAYRGFVLRGMRERQHFAHILVEPKDGGTDVHFIIYNDRAGNEKIIEELLRYIRPLEQAGS